MDFLDDLAVRELQRRARDPVRATDVSGEDWNPPRPFHPPADEQALAVAEDELGFSLPHVVKQVYTSVANGGFGPGYGLIGIGGGALDDQGYDVVKAYRLYRQEDPDDPRWYWPTSLLPVCHWGCAIYSCIDCTDDEARVVRFDPNAIDGDWSRAYASEGHTFSSWLQAWLRGENLWDAGFANYGHKDDRVGEAG